VYVFSYSSQNLTLASKRFNFSFWKFHTIFRLLKLLLEWRTYISSWPYDWAHKFTSVYDGNYYRILKLFRVTSYFKCKMSEWKVKLTPCFIMYQAMDMYIYGSGCCIASIIYQLHVAVALSPGKGDYNSHCTGNCMGPWFGVDAVKIFLHKPDIEPPFFGLLDRSLALCRLNLGICAKHLPMDST
jgi:hypothetical protein